MHAVIAQVTIGDFENAVAALREHVVPRVTQVPGFVTGYWTRKDEKGLSLIVFESEEAAQRAAEQLPVLTPEGVTFESVEVREVVAQA
jgi:heme-degrading monooxygenase HmoA